MVRDELRHLSADPGDDLRAGDPRPQPADRVQRPILAGPQRVLRHRRLYGGDPDAQLRCQLSSGPLPAAGGVCFAVGFLFGLPALRLQNLYLALATFALAIAMPQILKFHGFEDWTGGVQGLVLDQPDPPAFLPIDDRSVALLLHPRHRAGDVCRRGKPDPQPQRARDHGDPRQPDRRRGDGHQHLAVQDADLRRQRALYRRRRRARRACGRFCRAGQLHDFPVDLAAGRPGDRRRWLDPRLPLRRALRALRAEHRRKRLDRLGGSRFMASSCFSSSLSCRRAPPALRGLPSRGCRACGDRKPVVIHRHQGRSP